MKANQIIALGVSIIAIGVVAGGVTWGVKEYDKTKKINAKSECMGRRNYQQAMGNYYYALAERHLKRCLEEKGYSLRY